MKITLEFDSIEEQDDARVALDGYKWKLAMWDLDQLTQKLQPSMVHFERERSYIGRTRHGSKN
jgi:hypothetical protein